MEEHVIQVFLVLQLFLDQSVHPVKGHPAVVADDAATAVGVRQTGDHVALAGLAHFLGVDTEHPVVVGGAVTEFVFHLVAEPVAVGGAGLAGHADAAEGVDPPLQGLVGLQPNDEFLVLVDVTRGVAGQRGNGVHVNIQHAALAALLGEKRLHLTHQVGGSFGGTRKEVGIPGVGFVVLLNEVPHVDGVLPYAGSKIGPVFVFHGFHILLIR